MATANNKHETPKQQMTGESGNATDSVRRILEGGAEVSRQAEQAVSDAYDKTVEVVSETYEKTKNYSNENPGKTILVALGAGIGLGLFLSAGSRRSRTRRFAQPVVTALSDIALAFFR